MGFLGTSLDGVHRTDLRAKTAAYARFCIDPCFAKSGSIIHDAVDRACLDTKTARDAFFGQKDRSALLHEDGVHGTDLDACLARDAPFGTDSRDGFSLVFVAAQDTNRLVPGPQNEYIDRTDLDATATSSAPFARYRGQPAFSHSDSVERTSPFTGPQAQAGPRTALERTGEKGRCPAVPSSLIMRAVFAKQTSDAQRHGDPGYPGLDLDSQNLADLLPSLHGTRGTGRWIRFTQRKSPGELSASWISASATVGLGQDLSQGFFLGIQLHGEPAACQGQSRPEE